MIASLLVLRVFVFIVNILPDISHQNYWLCSGKLMKPVIDFHYLLIILINSINLEVRFIKKQTRFGSDLSGSCSTNFFAGSERQWSVIKRRKCTLHVMNGLCHAIH